MENQPKAKKLIIGVKDYNYKGFYGAVPKQYETSFDFNGEVVTVNYNNLRNGHTEKVGNEILVSVNKKGAEKDTGKRAKFSINTALKGSVYLPEIDTVVSASERISFYDSILENGKAIRNDGDPNIAKGR
jgi:hypothetical protein